MSKFVFVLKWIEPKSADFLNRQAYDLNEGFVQELKTLGVVFGEFEVKARADLEGNVVVLDWVKPSRMPDKTFEALLNEASKELEKKLECECSWSKQ